MNKKNLSLLLDFSISDKSPAYVQFKPIENLDTYALLTIFNSDFCFEYLLNLEEEYSKHKFITYDFTQLKRVLNDTKVKDVSLLFNENQLLEYAYNKKTETTKVTEHSLSYALPPEMFDELNCLQNTEFSNTFQLDEAFTILTSIKNSLELYPQLGKVFIYQDDEEKLHFNTTNGYSIYDTYLNLDMNGEQLLNNKTYSCDAAYAENLYHFNNHEMINMLYVKTDMDDYGLYLCSEETEFGIPEKAFFVKLVPDTLPFKHKLVLPKTIAFEGECDLNLKSLKSMIKDVKEGLASKDQKSFAIVLRFENGQVFLSEKPTEETTDMPDLTVNYYDLSNFLKTDSSISIEQDENYTVFKTKHSKLIAKN